MGKLIKTIFVSFISSIILKFVVEFILGSIGAIFSIRNDNFWKAIPYIGDIYFFVSLIILFYLIFKKGWRL
jgi:hypothetical protein